MCVLAAPCLRTFPGRCLVAACVLSHVVRHKTYGFVFVCGSNMCNMNTNRQKHRETFVETCSGEGSDLVNFYLCLSSHSLWAPRRLCCTWREACRKHFMRASTHVCTTSEAQMARHATSSNLYYYLT